MSQGVPQVIPQIPCDFKWQPSARVSQTIRSSSLSCDSSHHVTEAKCPPQPTHLPLLQRVDSTDDLAPRKWLGGILLLISLWKAQQEYWHLHNSHCRNTLIYVHMILCTLPTCDMSLGWLTVGVPEARDFVGSLVLDVCVCVCVCMAFLSVSPAETYYAYQFSLIHYYTDRKEHIHMTTIHQPPNAPNKTQFMTNITLLHISVLGCHPQGVS